MATLSNKNQFIWQSDPHLSHQIRFFYILNPLQAKARLHVDTHMSCREALGLEILPKRRITCQQAPPDRKCSWARVAQGGRLQRRPETLMS